MEIKYSWKDVVNVEGKSVQFGACHEFMSWRRHDKFENLENALTKGGNCSRLLLQSDNGNANSRNYKERGPVSHVALWYSDRPWAILMNKEEATLVSKTEIQSIDNMATPSTKAVREKLASLFAASPVELRHPLDKSFYKKVISCNG